MIGVTVTLRPQRRFKTVSTQGLQHTDSVCMCVRVCVCAAHLQPKVVVDEVIQPTGGRGLTAGPAAGTFNLAIGETVILLTSSLQ